MQVRYSHSKPEVEADSIKIKIHDKEYLLHQVADGLKIVDLAGDGTIFIRPEVANAIVVVTRFKNQ